MKPDLSASEGGDQYTLINQRIAECDAYPDDECLLADWP